MTDYPLPSLQLKETIEGELKQVGLQVTPLTITKVIQLHETKNSRHSTVIVGSTGSGKTVTWRTLQAALSALHRCGDPTYSLVRVSGGVPQTREQGKRICLLGMGLRWDLRGLLPSPGYRPQGINLSKGTWVGSWGLLSTGQVMGTALP